MKNLWIIISVVFLGLNSGLCADEVISLMTEEIQWSNRPFYEYLPEGGPEGVEAMKISNPDKESRKCSTKYPMEKIRGKKLIISANIKASEVSVPPKPFLGIRLISVIVKKDGKVMYREYAPKATGSFDWKKVKYEFEVPEDAVKGHLTIGLDQATGTVWYSGIEMRIVDQANNVLNPSSSVKVKPVNHQFKGELPLGWQADFCKWTESIAESSFEQAEGSNPFTRIVVKKTSPVVQLRYPLRRLDPNRTYRLSLTYRNHLGCAMKIAIREINSPYKILWTDRIQPDVNWQKKTFDFKVESKSPIGIFLIMEKRGTIDLSAMSLLPVESPVKPAPVCTGTEKNYLRNSRLPLGLQSGWSVGRSCVSPQALVSQETGPSGEKALTVTNTPIISEPFRSNSDVNQQLAFFCKGSGDGEVMVLETKGGLVRKKFKGGSEWQRITLPFKNKNNQLYKFSIKVNGTLLFDAFQATTEDNNTYSSAQESEIALALPESEISRSRIQFIDEAFEVKYYVSGKQENIEIHAKLTDLYGDTVHLPIQKDASGKFILNPLPNKTKGQFRLEAAVFHNGERISPWNELVITRLKRPAYWGKSAPDSPFGGHANPNPLVVGALKAAGMNWLRLHDAGMKLTLWGFLEKEKGKWSFNEDAINVYRKFNFKILGQLGGCPLWAAENKEELSSSGKILRYPTSVYQYPADINEYKNYVKTIVSHYKGVIDSYIIWNEPWLNGFLPLDKSRNRAEAYVALEKATYEAAKSVDPNTLLIGCNTGHGKAAAKWTQSVVAAGGLNYCDAIDYHQYTPYISAFPEDSCYGAFMEAWGSIIEKYGKVPKPVYFTEGQALCLDQKNNEKYWFSGMYKHTIAREDKEDYFDMSDRNVRFVLSILGLDVKKVFLYSSHSYEGLLKPQPFLCLVQADGYPHPQLAAYSAFTGNIENKKFVKRTKLYNNIYAYFFEGKNSSTAVIAPSFIPEKIILECSAPKARAYDLFGNNIKLPCTNPLYITYVNSSAGVDELASSLKISKDSEIENKDK